jgi:RNA recognition motif-containing protein
MNIYVGNISWDMTEEDLRSAFEPHGQVTSAKIITDKYTGRSRGFGFVEMPEKTEAEAAISNLNGKDLKGREIVVNEARPKKEGYRSRSGRNKSSRNNHSKW